MVGDRSDILYPTFPINLTFTYISPPNKVKGTFILFIYICALTFTSSYDNILVYTL